MTNQPNTQPPAPDSGHDDTETVAYSPTPEPRPEWARSAWLDPGDHAAPSPTHPVERPSWATQPSGPSWTSGSIGSGSAYEPARVSQPSGLQPGPSGAGGGGRSIGFGQVVAAALLSAILASGGTVLVLKSTGNLEQQTGAAAPTTPGLTASERPASINESSAVINAAAEVSPAVVRIFASGSGGDTVGGQIPEQGVGS